MCGVVKKQNYGKGVPPLTRNTTLTSYTVLVIDDDKLMRDILSKTLRLHGYRVITAATLQEAEAIKQRLASAVLKLVITDVHLTDAPQGREGYTLFERWTAASPSLTFLLISGDPGSKALPAIRTGVVPFLAKPFSPRELLNAVHALLDEAYQD